jgi:hypothetical protein
MLLTWPRVRPRLIIQSTALSAASRLKTSSRQPEKLGFVSKTVTRDICRTGLSWHSARPREGPVWSTCTLVGTPRSSGIGATAPFRGRLFQPVDDDPAVGWQGSASMETTVTTTENPAARLQRDPWNKGRLERRCRCLKINLTLTSGANTGYPHPLPGARGRPERALRLCLEGRP